MSLYMRERARRGAEWLDRAQPGWHDRLKTEALCMHLPDRCVAGQLFGDFNVWGQRLKTTFLVSHGFALRHAEFDNWRKLRDAWLLAIRERRRQVSPGPPAPGLARETGSDTLILHWPNGQITLERVSWGERAPAEVVASE